ncbi:MAG: sulfatase [Bacteroidales bacterium]
MNKNFSRLVLATIALKGLLLQGCTDRPSGENEERPNFVILIADDVSYTDFGCYGHPVLETPNTDELADDGIRFTNAFLTTSSSSPSRVSIITGRYPHNTGAPELHYPLPENQVVFPEILQEAGYYTAQAGKWHFGESGHKPSGPALEAFNRTGGSHLDGGGPSGSERWVEYLEERPEDKPFFMWFASHDAHRPWDGDYPVRYDPGDVVVPEYMVDNDSTRKDLASYYGEVTRFDTYVGKVIAELKKQEVFDNTFIIVMADNGRPFPREKTRLYDIGIKTPFVVHYPEGIDRKGEICNALISVIDIAPTIIDLAGTEAPQTFQGKSFSSLLEDTEKDFRNYVFAEHNWHDYMAHERMVRTERYLYIENNLWERSNIGAIDVLGGGAGQSLIEGNEKGSLTGLQNQIFEKPQPREEFFDCENDSKQFNNLAEKEQFQAKMKELRDVLEKWEKETHDSQPDSLTPDWYDRRTLEPLPQKGTRGILPGEDKGASKIHTPGPF